jgi:beta-glucosidase
MRPSSRGLGAAGLLTVHHFLLGQGLATEAVRAEAPGASLGGATPLSGNYAASNDPWDRIALEQCEAWSLRLFLDPLLLGRHMVLDDGRGPVEDTGCVRSGDLELISTSQDFLTLGWSGACQVAAPENLSRVLPAMSQFGALNDVNRLIARLGFVVAPLEGVATTTSGWPIMPEALADAVAAVYDAYADRLPPLWIMDRGSGDLDARGPSAVIDARRRALLASRLGWLAGQAHGRGAGGHRLRALVLRGRH